MAKDTPIFDATVAVLRNCTSIPTPKNIQAIYEALKQIYSLENGHRHNGESGNSTDQSSKSGKRAKKSMSIEPTQLTGENQS